MKELYILGPIWGWVGYCPLRCCVLQRRNATWMSCSKINNYLWLMWVEFPSFFSLFFTGAIYLTYCRSGQKVRSNKREEGYLRGKMRWSSQILLLWVFRQFQTQILSTQTGKFWIELRLGMMNCFELVDALRVSQGDARVAMIGFEGAW